MATKKATKSAGPERVDSKSFNGARRATVLRKHTAQREHSYFGAEFALIELDHYPTPIWSSAKFLKKPAKADLYEQLRADPERSLKALLELDPVELVRKLARVSGGQHLHHEGSKRWVGLARAMDPLTATDAFLSLIERVRSSDEAMALVEPATLDGSEYNKSDFKYGPNVRGDDVVFMLQFGLQQYWPIALSQGAATLEQRLPSPLLERAKKVWSNSDPERWTQPLVMPELTRVVGGLMLSSNEEVGLDQEFMMICGTGY